MTTPTPPPPAAERVDVRRAASALFSGPFGPATSLEDDLRLCDAVSRLMDNQFSVAGIKFGLDAVVGLVPVVGDLVNVGIGALPIFVARKHGLGRVLVARMAANLAADLALGLVPLAGDVVDVFFKANRRNFKLLRAAAERELGRRRVPAIVR